MLVSNSVVRTKRKCVRSLALLKACHVGTRLESSAVALQSFSNRFISLLTFNIIIHRSIVRVCKVCMYILLWVLLQESLEDKVNSNISEQFTVSITINISCR